MSSDSATAHEINGLAAVRARFASLPRLADSVQAAIQEYVDLRIRVGADWDAWVERSFVLAGKIARLIHAQDDEIAITASASAGINAVASAMDCLTR